MVLSGWGRKGTMSISRRTRNSHGSRKALPSTAFTAAPKKRKFAVSQLYTNRQEMKGATSWTGVFLLSHRRRNICQTKCSSYTHLLYHLGRQRAEQAGFRMERYTKTGKTVTKRRDYIWAGIGKRAEKMNRFDGCLPDGRESSSFWGVLYWTLFAVHIACFLSSTGWWFTLF